VPQPKGLLDVCGVHPLLSWQVFIDKFSQLWPRLRKGWWLMRPLTCCWVSSVLCCLEGRHKPPVAMHWQQPAPVQAGCCHLCVFGMPLSAAICVCCFIHLNNSMHRSVTWLRLRTKAISTLDFSGHLPQVSWAGIARVESCFAYQIVQNICIKTALKAFTSTQVLDDQRHQTLMTATYMWSI